MNKESPQVTLSERGPGRRSRSAPKDLAAALSSADYRRAVILLMDEHGDRAYNYCYRLLNDRTVAADVHQTVFLRAYENMGRLEHAAKAREWLFSIAHNCCMDELRRRRLEAAHVSARAHLPEMPVVEPPPEDGSDAPHTLKSLHECIEVLKPHVRYALLLRYQDEKPLTYEEMGRICREDPKTLQMRVARAMPLLRQCLERKGVVL